VRLPPPLPPPSCSKVRSTLHQLVRDWSAEGADERAQCYAPILAELKARLPVTTANVNELVSASTQLSRCAYFISLMLLKSGAGRWCRRARATSA
jgi:N2227-like protein